MEEEKADKLAEFSNGIPMENNSRLWNITRWSKFIAIAGFLLIAFIGVSVFAAYMQRGNSRFRILSNNQESSFFIIFASSAISAILLVFLLRFAIFTRRGIQFNDQDWFNEGINALKLYFIINGIAGILYCFFILATLITKIG